MKTELECLPCFINQVKRTLAYACVNGDAGRRVMLMAHEIIERSSLDTPPARISTHIHRCLRSETGTDPYLPQKRRYNRIALERLPSLRKTATEASDPLEAGVRLAAAGNIIDFGIYEHIDLDRSIEDSFHISISRKDFDLFSRSVGSARNILYLCDNAGEIVFDRVLIEILTGLGKSVTAVVKGSPVINDATMEDARDAGLMDSAKVIHNGSDGIGTLLETCSEDFLNEFERADMVISKGQANFETLANEGDNRVFFIFKVKCPVVSKALDRPEGEIVLMNSRCRI